ncbi:uncharacterized protein LOC113540687 [Pangasianodon hypophthalmus]|uniref:uncharacterized protein LOC113540687 n=1 Tax=Pangasianodon hypophthalmus TaxID=310915 RepID=UPI000EFEED56|nr:uncharacterized protein LOC113540687 [Pangasianodon hypophthalmus]
MNLTKLLYLTFLVLILCGFVSGFVISQPDSSVRTQPGFSTTFQCHVRAEGHYSFFWIKVPLEGASVYIANVNSLRGDVEMFGQFKNNPRIKVILNETSFSLLFLSTEPADIAVYICGAQGYEQLCFGNGSKLIVEDTAAIEPTVPIENEEERNIKLSVFDYAVPILSVTNVASIFIIIALIYHVLKKKKSGVTRPDHGTGEYNTDEVSYAALTHSHNQNYTPMRRTKVDTVVVYGVVQHQEGVEL